MAKKDVLENALAYELDVSMDNTVAEIEAAIDEFLEAKTALEDEPEKVDESLESTIELVVEPKLRAIRANISYSVVAGVGNIVFQDLENTGNRLSFEDGEGWEEISEKLRTFLMQ